MNSTAKLANRKPIRRVLLHSAYFTTPSAVRNDSWGKEMCTFTWEVLVYHPQFNNSHVYFDKG